MNKPDTVKRKAGELKRKTGELKRKAEELKRKTGESKRKMGESKRKTGKPKCKAEKLKRKAEAVKLLLKSIMKTLKTTVHYYTIHYKLCGGKIYKTENKAINYNQKIGAVQTNSYFIVGAKKYCESVLRLAGNIQERFVTEKSPLAGIAGSIGQHGNGLAGLVRK